MDQSEEKLGTERIGKLMLSMGIPTLVAQLINLLYNIVDRMYIGHTVGRDALTGVGLTLSVIMLISAFSALMGAGGAPLAAIAMGQGDKKRAATILFDGVNLLSESNRQNTPVTCFRFDHCLYYIRFFLFLQSPYMIF